MRVIGRTARSLSLGMVALLGVGTLTATAAPTTPPSVAKGNQWDVRAVTGGYQLTLHLDTPAPMRASLPLLEVDGKPLGVAKQSPDRKSLTLVSSDPAVVRARDVRLVWSGDLGKQSGMSRGITAAGPTDADWLKARRGPLLPADPGALGKYKVDTAEYNLGNEAVYLPGLGHRSELLGKVYSPRGAVGPRPLVVFLHGRHEVCYGDPTHPSDDDKPWPCPPGMKAIPSYRGYDGPATALASNGYQVVSISANAINAWDSEAYDAGAQARAELILDHLALWRKWSTTGGGPFGTRFVGKVDLRNVGLMGHSRGGEGVARAAVLNADRGGQYGIRAVLPLAPTDFARATVPGVAMSVVLPYCDGDVSDLQGQKFYDDTRYSVDGDNAARSTVAVMGANHNFFNTEWTPGQSVAPSNDDWFGDEKASPCGAKYPGRLTPKEQQAVGTAYVAGFFRLQLGREKQFLPQFDGSDSRAASAGKAVVRVVSQGRDVNRLDKALPAGAVTGKVTATVCAGVTTTGLRASTPTCMATDDWSNAPHWGAAWFAAKTPTTAVTKLNWTGTNGVVRVSVPAGQRDVRRVAALTFRAAPDPAGAPRTDLSVHVVDGHGRAAVVPVSAVSDALVRMPGSNDSGLPKNLLRTVRIPVSSLKGIDLRDVRAVELHTDKVASGSAYVSDLAFSSPGLGRPVPAALLPKLSASSVTVKEGDKGTHAVDFWVTMSRPSIRPVSVYVETNGELGESVGDVGRQLMFEPGQVRQKVSVPITGNTRDSYDLPFSLVLSAPHDGLLNESFGHGLVLDDDPTPTLTLSNLKTAEKTGLVNFGVKLSAPSDKFVSFGGVLKDGTAVIRKDYTSANDEGTGPVDRSIGGYVEPGQTTGELSVKILDDKLKEPAETFAAIIQQVDGADLKVPMTLTATIIDND
ncbi:Calx-beta domain-containing protein [Kribbella rubisoli]|uniref:Calx-beta domain-containing protein n=1 Tax=Kribbella rubisoli TaxID=3075929 RepID=A0A4V2FYS0_9ACTN|nr:Calx-beta domain-containing protein [Kribbella rubisoli]